MTPGQVLAHTFPALDLTTTRLYRVKVSGRRWQTIPAADDTDAIRTAQQDGAVVHLEEITR